MIAVYNNRILEKGLLPAAHNAFSDGWTLELDNAQIQTATRTENWLDAHEVIVLRWLAVTLYPNISENVWGLLVRLVYKDGATYDTVEQLSNAIYECQRNIDRPFTNTLYELIPNRCFTVIEKKGAPIYY